MFQELWESIETASDRKLPRAIADAAKRYDDMMLGYEVVPDEGIDFLIKLFSSERVLHASGIEHFLLDINVDLCKYTLGQRTRLLNVLVDNAGRVADELGRHSVGDFIARAYPSDMAFATFLDLAARSHQDRHVAFVGLDVLRMREPEESALYRKIEKKWLEVLNSESKS